MCKISTLAFACMCVVTTITSADAFVPLSFDRVYASKMNSKLCLVPEQGNQLAAAFNAAISKDQPDDNDVDMSYDSAFVDDEDDIPAPTITETSPRNFVQRAFNLPAMRKHPLPKLEGITDAPTVKPQHQDIVIYPVVGFMFCANGDRVIALPTNKIDGVSCSLPLKHTRKNDKHVVYGWYSPVCKLDLFSEDYCKEPILQ